MQSVSRYAEMVKAATAARDKLRDSGHTGSRWDEHARGYRFDPHRLLEPHVHTVVHLVHEDDTVIDVGGGAGRIGLPVALRAQHLTNVEPSTRMGREFLDLAAGASIANVEWVQEDWLEAGERSADVVMTADVAYFVPEIDRFVLGLHRAAKRRVVMQLWSVPPPNRDARLQQLAFGESLPPFPGFRELLEVLWDLELLPDVRVLNELFEWPEELPSTREEALAFALQALEAEDDRTLASRLEPHLDDLFEQRDGAFVPAWRHDGRAMIVSWAPPEFPGVG